ncbi:MAG: hypothetical protein GTN46_12170 [Gammaproteobacteria bacterium]|nr:hypothetical protein [Gammaproteobacteria bacterium]NIN62884.1 hypothetical protein [Gammaproteobacteria bacterium]NIO63865.1 hypothetical protein [Gammaproteobacteria bacterium]NIQ12461.1 hypothetical protein [Gammaproteobacteria bacterium]NIT06713.1 hypothetical protein [Gammaproteobacteria bacterium]
MSATSSRKVPYIVLAMLLFACFIIYYPASQGGFIYDDLPNIVSNKKLQIDSLQADELLKAMTSGKSGPLKRPVSMLSFAINYYFTGLNPYYFRIVNILIHLINGLLIYILTRKIIGLTECKNSKNKTIEIASLATTALWLFHPINISGVVYIVQRINELAALFTLTGLILFIYGRQMLQERNQGRFLIASAFLFCAPLAVFSKENGALIVLFIGLLELVFFKFKDLKNYNKLYLAALYCIFIIIPFIAILLSLYLEPQILLSGYKQQEFTLYERILTEQRVLWFYIYMIFVPDITQLSLFHDDIVLSRSLVSPATTSIAVAGTSILLILALILRKQAKILSFGMLFFLSGHLIESTILPLQIAFEHRNYLPSYGLVLIAAYYLTNKEFSEKTVNIRRILFALLIVIVGVSTYIKSTQWANTQLLIFYELEHKPESSQLNYEAGIFFAKMLDKRNIKNQDKLYENAEKYFHNAIELNPNNTEAMIGLIILSSSNGYKTDVSVIEQLANTLSSQPITITGNRAIHALLKCQLTNECVLRNDVINRLIDSVLDNRYLSGERMELIYKDIFEYYVSRDDLESAYRVSKKGVINDESSIILRILYIRLLIMTDNMDDARKQLELLGSTNTKEYESDISMLNAILNRSSTP